MEITKPALDALEELVSLWLELAASQREFDAHLLVAENDAAVREMLSRKVATGNVLVARADDAIVGFVTFCLETGAYEQDLNRGLVENLYVTAPYQGHGVGSTLLETAETELQELGAEAVALEVLAANDRARGFYREQGYEPQRLELEKEFHG